MDYGSKLQVTSFNLTFCRPPLHPLMRNVARIARIARSHGEVQRCALAQQANMHRFHVHWDTSGLRSICELLFLVLYVIYMKYGIRGIIIKESTQIDLLTDLEFSFFCLIRMKFPNILSSCKSMFVSNLFESNLTYSLLHTDDVEHKRNQFAYAAYSKNVSISRKNFSFSCPANAHHCTASCARAIRGIGATFLIRGCNGGRQKVLNKYIALQFQTATNLKESDLSLNYLNTNFIGKPLRTVSSPAIISAKPIMTTERGKIYISLEKENDDIDVEYSIAVPTICAKQQAIILDRVIHLELTPTAIARPIENHTTANTASWVVNPRSSLA